MAVPPATLNKSNGVPAVGAVVPVGIHWSSTGVYLVACNLMRWSSTEWEQPWPARLKYECCAKFTGVTLGLRI
jgi:hypothetical protein